MKKILSQIAWTRIFFGALAIGVSVLCAIYGQPLLHGKENAIETIVTVFSILAGFLVAITSIMGDPSLLLPGSWRIAEAQRKEINKKLIRQQTLFLIYLATLFLIFLSQIIEPEWVFKSGNNSFCYSVWIERLYIFLASLGTIVSFTLPYTLSAIQKERVDAVIEARKSGKAV